MASGDSPVTGPGPFVGARPCPPCDAKLPGNPTRSFRSREPLRVVDEVAEWQGHPPERLQALRDSWLCQTCARHELPWPGEIVRAKRPARLSVVPSPAKMHAVLAQMDGTTRLLYGSGPLLLECCRLRVKDVNFERSQIVVRSTSATSPAAPAGSSSRTRSRGSC